MKKTIYKKSYIINFYKNDNEPDIKFWLGKELPNYNLKENKINEQKKEYIEGATLKDFFNWFVELKTNVLVTALNLAEIGECLHFLHFEKKEWDFKPVNDPNLVENLNYYCCVSGAGNIIYMIIKYNDKSLMLNGINNYINDFENHYDFNLQSYEREKQLLEKANELWLIIIGEYNKISKQSIKMPPTVGALAFRMYANPWNKDYMNYIKHNLLTKDENKKFHNWFKGGYSWNNPEYSTGIVENVTIFDMNSIYAFVMKFLPLPKLNPIYDCKNNDCSKIHLQLYQIYIKKAVLKPKKCPIISDKPINGIRDYKKQVKDFIDFVTNIDLNKYIENYNIDYDIDNKICFEKQIGMFNKYINKYWNWKASNEKGTPKNALSKNLLVRLFGYFGKGIEMDGYEYIKRSGGKYNGFEMEPCKNENNKIMYNPVAIFTSSYARSLVQDVVNDNYNNFVATDTDSLHLVNCDQPNGVIIGKGLGEWKNEGKWKKNSYPRSKVYMNFCNNYKDEHICDLKKCAYNKKMAGVNNQPEILNNIDIILNKYGFETIQGGVIQNVKVIGGVIKQKYDFSPLKYRNHKLIIKEIKQGQIWEKENKRKDNLTFIMNIFNKKIEYIGNIKIENNKEQLILKQERLTPHQQLEKINNQYKPEFTLNELHLRLHMTKKYKSIIEKKEKRTDVKWLSAGIEWNKLKKINKLKHP